jgi:hypothetical protein
MRRYGQVRPADLSHDRHRPMARVRGIYGIRCVAFNATERTLRIEYDASRLSESVMTTGLLRTEHSRRTVLRRFASLVGPNENCI